MRTLFTVSFASSEMFAASSFQVAYLQGEVDSVFDVSPSTTPSLVSPPIHSLVPPPPPPTAFINTLRSLSISSASSVWDRKAGA